MTYHIFFNNGDIFKIKAYEYEWDNEMGIVTFSDDDGKEIACFKTEAIFGIAKSDDIVLEDNNAAQ